jgi:uridine kinase
MEIPKKIVDVVKNLEAPSIIAVSGFGGAGKSTFSDLLGEMTNIPVIRLDSFAQDRLENNPVLWDSMDFDRLEKEVLIPFSNQDEWIKYGNYHWGENRITKTNVVENKGKLIIEGVGLLRPRLNNYFAYKIWVDVPKDESVRRGKKRDREIHNIERDKNWDGIWMVNDTEYFDTFKPKEVADYIFVND